MITECEEKGIKEIKDISEKGKSAENGPYTKFKRKNERSNQEGFDDSQERLCRETLQGLLFFANFS